MKTILLSPFSNPMPKGENPKSYPIDYCNELIILLKKEFPDDCICHVKLNHEPVLQGTVQMVDYELTKLISRIKDKDTRLWISVDNFFHHLAWLAKSPGFVVFSKSDPFIFGHDKNVNILKSLKYRRPDTFGYWWDCPYQKEAFPPPDYLVETIKENRGKIWD
jgi:hypothetical protein